MMRTGFLISIRRDAPQLVRGWPKPVTAGRHEVWFHGYLAEPTALRSRLGLDSDAGAAELLEAAWRRWRGEITEHVLGEYTAVLSCRAEVAVVADRMGLRPVYCCRQRDTVTISTDLGLLATETAAWRRLDEDYIADVLSSGRHLGPRTPYADIIRLTAGQYATWTADKFAVHGGWRPAGATVDISFADHQERLRSTVERVVVAAGTAGPIAVELSGGLDSSTLLAVLARSADVHALSFIYPDDPQSDETPWIQAALAETPAPWHPIDAVRHGYFVDGPDFGRFLPAPSRRILNWALSAAEDRAAAGVGAQVIISGEGGDAVFLGGLLPWYLADLMRTGRWRTLLHESARWTQNMDMKRPTAFWLRRAAVDAHRAWRRGEVLTMEPHASVAVKAPWLDHDFVVERGLDRRSRATGPIRASSVHQQAILEGIMLSAEAVRGIHASGARAGEVRAPLLAPPLVDLALATPWHIGVDPRIDRAVQRYAFRGVVSPVTLRRRSKPGIDAAIFGGLERHAAWRDYLQQDSELVTRGYVDGPRWATAVDRATVGRTAGIAQFHSAVQIEVWLRHLRYVGTPQFLNEI